MYRPFLDSTTRVASGFVESAMIVYACPRNVLGNEAS